MKTPEENHETDVPDDAVWELLKRARRTQAGPYFSRRVLREARQSAQEPRSWPARCWNALRLRPAAMAGGALTAATAVVALFLGVSAWIGDADSTPMAVTPNAASPLAAAVHGTPADADYDPASEVGNLEYLGQLMAVSDPATLDDAALADLLF